MKSEAWETINIGVLITNLSVLLMLISGIAPLFGQSASFYKIPEQVIYPFRIMNDTIDYKLGFTHHVTTKKKDYAMKVKAFDVSSQITLGEYKKYLDQVKIDSSRKFYLAQFPDSTILSHEMYREYISSPKYDNYPIVGISWYSALNYCKWRTLKENKGDTIKFVYRLPLFSEWLTAYDYLNNKKIKNDLSRNYSDWTLATMEEAFYDFTSDSLNYFSLDHVSFLGEGGEKVRIRKRFLGGCYFFQRENLIDGYGYGYADAGYKYVGFRLVKIPISEIVSFKKFNEGYFWQEALMKACRINIFSAR